MDILAPIDDVGQIKLFRYVGATEFYCGYVPYDWFGKYNKTIEKWSKKDMQLSLNRREIGYANITTQESIGKIIEEAHKYGVEIYITVNAPAYSAGNYPFLTDYINMLESLGIDGLIISDVGLLQKLKGAAKTKTILSTCNQVSSIDGVKFMKQLGVNRIVFPRHISLKQMEKITDAVPEMEYECFILEGKCIYDDGNCNILHSCGSFCAEMWYTQYYDENKDGIDEAKLYDNEEDFLELTSPYLSTKLPSNGWRNMGCGICSLEYIIKNIKMDSLKIAGRGLDNRQKMKNISILKKAIDLAQSGATHNELKSFMQQYQQWKELCEKHYRCYFPDFEE